MNKVLVVDDEPRILSICRRVIENQDVQVYTASTAEQASGLLASETYDLVITDLNMPDLNGLELLKKIKQLYPQTAVIIITGQATVESAVDALKGGAYDYILKPFSISELSSLVKKCLEHQRLLHQENILLDVIHLYKFYQESKINLSEEAFLLVVLERVIKTLRADSGSIFIFSPKDDTLKPVATSGFRKNRVNELKLGERVIGWVAKNSAPLLINDEINKLPQFKDLAPRPEIASSVVAPLLGQQVLLGVICINRLLNADQHPFTGRDLESVKMFALHLALVLTSLRHQQALVELNDLKSGFVSNVSHEIRTPIMAISGAVEILKTSHLPSADNPKAKVFLDLIARNTERMRLLVNDLLDFSRLESGHLKLAVTRFNVGETVREIAQDIELKAKEKNITIRVEEPGESLDMEGDREKIKQVLSNLLGNAIKFSPEAGEIRVGYRHKENIISFSVEDSGPGIPGGEHDKIFEKFYQVDNSASREKTGFGLGLAIVKSIVDKHRGKVWVESEEGKGAHFFVELPCSCPLEEKNNQ